MNELLSNIGTKVGGFAGKFSKKTKMLVAAILGGAIIFSAVGAIILNNQPYETLFASLNQQESSEIIGKLNETGVNYKFETDGTILVPKEQVDKLKAQFVSEGYPKSGFTYDVFKSNIDLMTTDFEKNNYKIFDLQNRIEATIGLFDGVKEAKVTIALGEEQKYVVDKSATEASASVVVVMQDGGSPSEEQALGIQRLVSTSIPGLKFENIAIVDGNGIDVSPYGDGSQAGTSKLKMEIEKEIEDSIKSKVLLMLSSIYGPENVKVTTKCTVDVDKKIREIINYTPNADNKGIPSSEVIETETTKGGDGAGGVVGAQTNADTPATGYSVTTQDGTEVYFRDQQSRDFLVNQVKEQAQSDAGVLTDLTVSVAINDMDINTTQMNEIRRLVGVTAGIETELQNDKIAIVNLPFYKAPVEVLPEIFESGVNWVVIGAAIAGVLLLLIVLFVVLSKRKKSKKGNFKASDSRVAVAPKQKAVDTSEPDLLNIKNDKGMQLKEKIRDFSDENPEISAQLIKSWLKGGGDSE